jgi:hypothetical protein
MAPNSPEAERQIAQARARSRGQRWMAGEAELLDSRFGARTFGPVAEITPGMEIWTREDARRDWHGDPLGGIVVHVDPGAPDTVTVDGEIIKHPARYRCYDPLAPFPWRCFVTLDENDIQPSAIAVAPSISVVGAIRRFCREVGTGPRTLDAHHAQLVTDAHRLVAVLMGGHR